MNKTSAKEVIVIGGGPAGLTAAYELLQQGFRPIVLEASSQVGGISRTEVYKGYRFDIGGHRFFTKVSLVKDFWHKVLTDDFIRVKRLSRIYYGGKYYDYPLNLKNTLGNLGLVESGLILLSYIKAKIFPVSNEQNFEEWVSNRFGHRLYNTFFKTYTEKVWGISCTELRAEWAAQRIKGLSLPTAVLTALNLVSRPKSLIEVFDYPRHGPGMLWERCAELIEQGGGEVRLNSTVVAVEHDGAGKVTSVHVENKSGDREILSAEQVISSMPITELIQKMSPEPATELVVASKKLKYRAFLIVALIIRRKDIFPDQWLYIHDAGYVVGRIQNFKNWSIDMLADTDNSCIGMEYFCNEGDDFWNTDDSELIALAKQEMQRLGFAELDEVEDGVVIRQPKSYPVYDSEYHGYLKPIREYLADFSNLQTVGRNGMHRYNNQDHSMLTAFLAVKNLCGEQHDLWQVNVDQDYHEEAHEESH
ncbi:MAG: NAD(P)-binding protein [Methyloprofundus sp.]|nr:NAD(P)-binding protein [Methyloprofundus sp.]